jgi:hypothetical protein
MHWHGGAGPASPRSLTSIFPSQRVASARRTYAFVGLLMERKAAYGEWVAGARTFGYRIKNSRLIPDDTATGQDHALLLAPS